jgi:ADP-ribose pyrophosphatase
MAAKILEAEIRTIEERLVYAEPENPWLKLYFDRVRFPDGSIGRYNRVVEGAGHPGVAVLPISAAGVGLVRQYRYAIADYQWEIPRGYGDGPDSAAEASRELLEETGLSPLRLIDLGSIHPNSAIFATRVALFVAQCDPAPAERIVDARELVQFKWFAVAEAMAAAESGLISDAMTLSALLRARLRRLI